MNATKELFVLGLAIYSVIILTNPFSIATPEIPDAAPLIGNIDDVAAVGILVGVSKRWFGFNPLKVVEELVN